MKAEVVKFGTAIGMVELTTDWHELAWLLPQRHILPKQQRRTIKVEVRRDKADKSLSCKPDANPRLLLVDDAKFVVSPDAIFGAVPEKCRAPGLIIEWLHLALPVFCAPDGWECLHAAAVERNGKVILIVGASGSGKTTVMREFVAQGWTMLADDTVLLNQQTKEVRGWGDDLHLSLEDAQHLGVNTLTLDVNNKVRVMAMQLGWQLSNGGKLERVIILDDKLCNPYHTCIEMGTTWINHNEELLQPVAYWGQRPADLAKRVQGMRRRQKDSKLAICTPFAGKQDMLEHWLAAFDKAGFPQGAQVIWLYNGSDKKFLQQLGDAAEERRQQHEIQVFSDTHRIGLKDAQVAYLWQQIRTRIPAGINRILTLEDDVLMPKGAWTYLQTEYEAHYGEAIVGLPVAHDYIHGNPCWLVWDYERSGEGVRASRDMACRPLRQSTGIHKVGGLSFSCTLIPRELFDKASLSPADASLPAAGYDHQFCLEAAQHGYGVFVLWDNPAEHMRQAGQYVQVLDKPQRKLAIIGSGHINGNLAGWDIARDEAADNYLGQQLSVLALQYDYAVLLNRHFQVTPGYLEACMDYLDWHTNCAMVSGDCMLTDGRIRDGSGAAQVVRLSACHEAEGAKTLEALRQHFTLEGWEMGWGNGWPRLAVYHSLNGIPHQLPEMIDTRRKQAAYQVVKLNRSPYRGMLPGFGGDVVQLEGYRQGLWALGIPTDFRAADRHFTDFRNYQIVHLYHSHLGWAPLVAREHGGKPLVVSAITHRYPQKWECEETIREAAAVICYTEDEAGFYADMFPDCKGKLRVVPMGVNAALYDRNPTCAAEKRVFMAGRYCDYKNQLACLRACVALEVPVTFAGFDDMGDNPEGYRKCLEAEAAGHDVEILPKLSGEELWYQYDRAWVHVNCSRFEPFGQVTLDALALGCNIVHTFNGWAGNEFYQYGSICDPDDENIMQQVIMNELNAERGWAKHKPPTWLEAAAAMKRVYEEVLSGSLH